tara:strand:+ start:225 stop:425 length:201 start_codon:yes stop_codon:yes gene_type:complete
MKWALVVYFFVAGTWQTAETLSMDGWYRTMYADAEQCIQAQNHFAHNTQSLQKQIRAQCEHIGSYD